MIRSKLLKSIVSGRKSPYKSYTPPAPLPEFINTPEFKSWFKDSKVANRWGQPIIVHHGSPDLRFLKENGIFQTLKERYGEPAINPAFFFVDDYSTARSYADPHRAYDYQNSEPGVASFFLSIKNPLILDNKGERWKFQTEDNVELAYKGGHDGIIIKNTIDTYQPQDGKQAANVYVVFSSNQIKAVKGNSGKFDPNQKSVYASQQIDPTEFASEVNAFNKQFQSTNNVDVKEWGNGTKVKDSWNGPQAITSISLYKDGKHIGNIIMTAAAPEGVKTLRLESVERTSDSDQAKGVVSKYLHDYINSIYKQLAVNHIVVAGNHAPNYWKHFATKHPEIQWDFNLGKGFPSKQAANISNFKFEPGFDPKLKKLINQELANEFDTPVDPFNATYEWSIALAEEGYANDVVNGLKKGEESSWLQVKGKIFDPIASYPGIFIKNIYEPEQVNSQGSLLHTDKKPRQLKPKPKLLRPVVKSDNFKAWFGKSKVTNEKGKPLVVYHGTTHDFESFNADVTNPDGYYGKGIYLTSSPEDASENYAGIGPDLKSRIEGRTDEIINEWMDEDVLADEDEFTTRDLAKEQAEKELKGSSEGHILPCYVSIQNPVIVDPAGGTRFEVLPGEENEEGDYEDSSSEEKMWQAFKEAGWETGIDGQEVWVQVSEELSGGINAFQLERVIRMLELITDNGELFNPGFFLAELYKALGFDGIIQKNVDRQFSNMDIPKGTSHFIVWDPTKVKSATGNSGKFDPTNPSVTANVNPGMVNLIASLKK